MKAGADVHWKDDHERSVLHSADNADVARAFIEAGADVNYINQSSYRICFESPLHEAVSNRGTGVVKVFLEAGADVNAHDNYGMTPLFRSRNFESAQLLIEAGADINAISNDGLTASQSIRKWGAVDGSSALADFIETHAIKVEKAKLQTTLPAAQPQPVKRKAKVDI
jgi:ankyrin repeat protein